MHRSLDAPNFFVIMHPTLTLMKHYHDDDNGDNAYNKPWSREIIDPALLYLRMYACMYMYCTYILVCICEVFVYSYLP